MKSTVELRESPHDEKTVSFSLIVSRARAPAMRRYLESLVALMNLEAVDGPEEIDFHARTESPSQALKRLRLERGLTQKAVATLLGVSQARVSDFEQGVKSIPVEAARQLAAFFQVSSAVFLQ